MGDSVLVEFLIKTNSKQSQVIFDKDLQKYVVHVKSAPTKGKANKEILNLLKKYFIASDVVLIKGFTSSTKLFEIKGAKETIQK